MIFWKILKRIQVFISTYKYGVVLGIGLLLVILMILFFIFKKDENKSIYKPQVHQILDCNREKYATVFIEKTNKLKDLNDCQLLHAQANGLTQVYEDDESFKKDVNRLVAEKELIRIKSNSLYSIKKMTHSHPYVTPEMADLINEIAIRFREKMKQKGIDYLLPVVTSALRTGESQKKLSRRNRNATEYSTHMFGTTVDITYKDFYHTKNRTLEQNATATNVLTEVIVELREQCRLVAVKERRQACFHFTVVNCAEHKMPSESMKFTPLLIHQ